jgi:glycosyltransferase involved in cell wall biosynthesis
MLSIVVPLYNEEQSLDQLHRELVAALDPLGEEYEIVFVDDGSTDGSLATLTEIQSRSSNVVVVHLRANFGKAAALKAGFLEASGDVVLTLDADLQDDPAEIPKLLAKLDEGFDLVSGWKAKRNDPWSRRVASRIFNRTVAFVSGVRLHDVNCGFKAYRAETLRGMRLYGELHRFIPILAALRGFRIAEVSVNHRPRLHGRSRYGPSRYLRGVFDLLTVTFMSRYRHRPLHLFGGLGLLMGSVGVLVLVYLTVIKIAGAGIGDRPLLMLGVLMVVVGVQLVSLGLLSELITSHHEERMDERERMNLVVDEVLRS